MRTHTAQTQAQYLLRLTLEFTSELTSALSANIVAMRPRQHVRHLIDLKVKSIAIFMSQRAGNARIYYRRLTKNLVAQTLR